MGLDNIQRKTISQVHEETFLQLTERRKPRLENKLSELSPSRNPSVKKQRKAYEVTQSQQFRI